MGGKAKGGSYERLLARSFSTWWTGGERDDVFWRTAGSGGMATNRSRKGKGTFGQCGDLQAVDPVGRKLMRLVTIEAKRGHKDANLGDMLDRKPSKKPRPLEVFLSQAKREQKESHAHFWMLIVRRDARQALVYLPMLLYTLLADKSADMERCQPWGRFRYKGRNSIFVTSLDSFFAHVTPKHCKEVLRDLEE